MFLQKFESGAALDVAGWQWPEGAHYQDEAGGHLLTLFISMPSGIAGRIHPGEGIAQVLQIGRSRGFAD